ncbi:hypothetical protein ACNVED_11865 [Legionella sp. D16C41]|uniref:hypothetical protein n=1 Tax=Legionella sp. D16C41 TaxID=3402688 RepID=UPI003AF481DA
MYKLVIVIISIITFNLTGHATAFHNNDRHQIIQSYLKSLSHLDADSAISLFVPDGIVISRHQGQVKAMDFLPAFVQKFNQLEMKELMFFVSENNDLYAVEIGSTGVKVSGEPVSSTFMVIFQFAKYSNQFEKIIIFANDTLKYPPTTKMIESFS